MSLAEIIAEGKRLVGKDDAAFLAFFIEHGPRLLAVAEAADRIRDYTRHAPICTGSSERQCDCGLVEAEAAFDAAASGEGLG